MALKKVERFFELTKTLKDGFQLRTSDQKTVRQNARAHLQERLGRLHGLPHKMAQILSMQDDDESLSAPTHSISQHSLPFNVIKDVLESRWDKPLNEVVQSMEENGQAASLGQVHRATLMDGRVVAVKVLYPDIEEAVHQDLKYLGWLSVPVGSLKRGFDLEDYKKTILKDLQEEMDYALEARQQIHFKQLVQGIGGCCVPEVIPELSNSSVLVSSWEEGWDIEEISQKCDESTKKEFGRILVKLFCYTFFQHRFLHADPNPGNYKFRIQSGQPQVVIYDFGCIYKAGQQEELYLLKLLKAMIYKEEVDPYSIFLKLGFRREFLEPLRPKLAVLCEAVFEAFVANHAVNLRSLKRGQQVSDILGEDRWNFRMAGPAHLIFFTRAMAGVEYYLKKLNVEISWRKCLDELINQKKEALDQLPCPEEGDASYAFANMAKHLHVEVKNNGITKVKLTFPRRGIDSLEELMGEDIMAKVHQRNISISDLIQKARQSGYQPMELFMLADGEKSFRVWLQ